MQTPIRTLSLLIVATTLGSAALAQTSPALNTVKLGGTLYTTHSQTNGISGIGVPAGADATTGDASTLLFTFEREVAPRLGIELAAGVPPRIKSKATGSMAALGEVMSAKNVAPTAFVNYHFGEPGSALRPYAGLGVNFTRFVGIESPYGWQVSLSDSWGWAAQAGLDYSFNRQWGLFASVAALQVKSDMVAVGATVLRTTIDFRPIVYSAGLTYKF